MPTVERTPVTVGVTLLVWVAAIASAGWIMVNPDLVQFAFVPGTLATLCWVAMALLR